MGVVRLLLRISAVQASKGRTLAMTDVFDSKIEAMENLLKDGKRPVLIFSIEESEQKEDDQPEGGFLNRCTDLTMLVQAAVASAQEIKDGDDTVVIAGIGESDAAFEATLDILDRQWRMALHDDGNSWAAIFRNLVTKVESVVDTRAVDPQTGRKHAARFTQVKLKVVDEPLPGDPLPACIEAGLTAMADHGDTAYAEVARVFRSLLVSGAGMVEWDSIRSQIFVGRDDMDALGFGAFGIDDPAVFRTAQLVVNDQPSIEVSVDDP